MVSLIKLTSEQDSFWRVFTCYATPAVRDARLVAKRTFVRSNALFAVVQLVATVTVILLLLAYHATVKLPPPPATDDLAGGIFVFTILSGGFFLWMCSELPDQFVEYLSLVRGSGYRNDDERKKGENQNNHLRYRAIRSALLYNALAEQHGILSESIELGLSADGELLERSRTQLLSQRSEVERLLAVSDFLARAEAVQASHVDFGLTLSEALEDAQDVERQIRASFAPFANGNVAQSLCAEIDGLDLELNATRQALAARATA